MTDGKEQETPLSSKDYEEIPFEQRVQEKFEDYFLFYEIFSEPACRRMYPLLALYPWKPQSLRKFKGP